jgi:hypothetical protein
VNIELPDDDFNGNPRILETVRGSPRYSSKTPNMLINGMGQSEMAGPDGADHGTVRTSENRAVTGEAPNATLGNASHCAPGSNGTAARMAPETPGGDLSTLASATRKGVEECPEVGNEHLRTL